MKLTKPSATIIEPELRALTLPQRLELCGRTCYQSFDKITESSAEAFVKKVFRDRHQSVLEMASLTFKISAANVNSWNELAQFKFLTMFKLPTHGVVAGNLRAFLEAYEQLPSNDVLAAIRKIIANRWPVFTSETPIMLSYVVASELDVETLPWPLRAQVERVAVRFTVNRAVSHELVRHRPASFLQESQRYCAYRNHVTFIDPRGAFPKWDFYFSDWQNSCFNAELDYKEALQNGLSPQAARTLLPNAVKTELLLYTTLAHWKQIFELRTTAACDPSMLEVTRPLHAEFKQNWPEVFGRKR